MRLHLDTSELDKLVSYWQKSPEITGREVQKFMIQMTEHLEGEWKEGAPVGESGGNGGGYRSSISAQPVELLSDKVIGVVGSVSPYAIPIEVGTKPHMPPIAPLMDWAQAVLGVATEEEQKQVAWAVAGKIKRDGTEAQNIAKDTWEENYYQVEQNFQQLLVDIRDQIGRVH